MRARQFLLKTACVAALLGVSATWAMTAPAMSARSGRSTVEEFQLLNASASDDPLKLVLASKGSGAYVADFDITVPRSGLSHVVLYFDSGDAVEPDRPAVYSTR